MKHPVSAYFNRMVVFPFPALSPDGKRVAYLSSVTGSPQIWLGSMCKGLLEFPRPLTAGTEKQPYVLGPKIDWAGPDRLVAVMDRHGDEATFIEVTNLKTGERYTLDDKPGTRSSFSHIGRDNNTIFLSSNRDNPVAQALYTFDMKNRRLEKWFEDSKSFSASWLGEKTFKGHRLFMLYRGAGHVSIHGIHPKTKKVIDVFHKEDGIFIPVGEWRKGKWLVVSDQGRQFSGLAIYDFKTGEFKWLGRDQWDVEFADVSPDKKHLVVSRNVAGRSEVEILTWPALKKLALKVPKDGVIDGLSFSKNGKEAVFSMQSPTETRNLYHLDLRSRKVRPLTDTWTSPVPHAALVKPELVKYESNGKSIHAWFYRPKGAKKDASLPVIVWPHGGPQFQERASIRPIFQYFVARGFAVWAPNPSGSTGYGKDFMRAIEGQWGTADLPDMQNGIAWLKSSGWIDEKRIAIMGGSYGGYMTLRSITRLPEVFKVAVDIFGPSNLLTFAKSVPPDWTPYMDQLLGNPERDKEKLMEQSPIFSLDKIRCPLLVIQGAKDPRVVQAESDQIVEALKKRGHPVDYIVFEDEGHGFFKLENELKAYTAAADFLEKYLG
ncbi:MAG: S9 family peptidase [Bdellovibrionales bacterium]|nr:S9 family peptidase [Bdellovibrionales bacterium]